MHCSNICLAPQRTQMFSDKINICIKVSILYSAFWAPDTQKDLFPRQRFSRITQEKFHKEGLLFGKALLFFIAVRTLVSILNWISKKERLVWSEMHAVFSRGRGYVQGAHLWRRVLPGSRLPAVQTDNPVIYGAQRSCQDDRNIDVILRMAFRIARRQAPAACGPEGSDRKRRHAR